MPAVKASSETKGTAQVYTLIFFLALVTWIAIRNQTGYSQWIAKARAQDWITQQGMIARKRSAADGETDGSSDDFGANLDSDLSAKGADSSAPDKQDGEKGEGEGDEKEAEDDADDQAAPKLDDMEIAREQLIMLEAAVAARSAEEHLYLELMNTRDLQAQLQEPPPPGPADKLFMQNFHDEIATLSERWVADFGKIKSAQRDPSEAAGDDTILALSSWQDKWESRELDRLLLQTKEKNGYVSLTGKKAEVVSLVAREMEMRNAGKISKVDATSPVAKGSSSRSSNQTPTKGAVGTDPQTDLNSVIGGGKDPAAASINPASESKISDFGIDAVVPLRIHLPEVTNSGNVLTEDDADELLATLKNLEMNAMQWTETSKKQVIILGNKGYIRRDLGVYEWAFSRLGFALRPITSQSGRISTKQLASGDWSVLLCLALNNDNCFTSGNLDKTKRYQRINRVQGLRDVLWNKHAFCATLTASARGSVHFGKYIFECWVLPREYRDAMAYEKAHPNSQYIVKPLSKGGGMGITVSDGERGLKNLQFHLKKEGKLSIVQNYLHNPMLINKKKWDLRTYVLVTSVLPLRCYVYNRGLVRFASSDYVSKAKKGGKVTAFLTNTSVNKKAKGQNVTSLTWSFEDLHSYLDARTPGSSNILLAKKQAAISIVFLSAERAWRKYFDGREICTNCYQLMGVDLIVDDQMQVKVIEVNGQPSMQLTKSEVDHYTATKKNMVRDLTELVYNEDRVAADLTRDLSTFDRDLITTQLTTRDHEYLLEYYREKQALGGFLPVYPSHRHFRLHEEFFKYQTKPPTEEARLNLHHILGALEQKIYDNGGPKKTKTRDQAEDEDDGPPVADEAEHMDEDEEVEDDA